MSGDGKSTAVLCSVAIGGWRICDDLTWHINSVNGKHLFGVFVLVLVPHNILRYHLSKRHTPKFGVAMMERSII